MDTRKAEERMVERILADHTNLKRLIDMVARRVAALPETEADWEDLAKYLQDLRRQLQDHFNLEEEIELVEDILQRLPSAEHTLNRLADEHDEFLLEMDHLIGAFNRQPAGEELSETCRRTHALFEKLHQHEAVEGRLLQQSYTRDLGTSD